jgi:hypothetical protein
MSKRIPTPIQRPPQGSPAEYGASLKLAIERGLLWLHESGTYLKLTSGCG